MPLARYEIRNEYSLANPDLYRAAAKDDPEGLLEGVAMAGLVGIVRQLGDLAEFAAEVFHDLHEEVYATAARGHELLIRVQQLEAELPVIEKLMHGDSNKAKFSYSPGVEWHASIRNDQNHFTQGDLPRFIRNAYEDCRGPPRLFLLDKFDVAGAGACLKRYTDPSFFKMEWASSELLKAEKEQQDKKARRIKKKGQRRRNGEIKEAGLFPKIHPRMHYAPLDGENLASTSSVHSNVDSEGGSKASVASIIGNSETADPIPASASKLVTQHSGDSFKVNVDADGQDVDLISDQTSSNLGKICIQEIVAEAVSAKPGEIDGMDVVMQKDRNLGIKAGDDAVDDVASETDHYMDALTTMDSEVETDSETKLKVEAESEFDKQVRKNEAYAPLHDSTSDEAKASDDLSLHTEEDDVIIPVVTGNSKPSENLEPVILVESLPKVEISCIEEVSPSVQQSHVSLCQERTVSSSLNDSNISLSPSKANDISRPEVQLDARSINLVSETIKSSDSIDHDNIPNKNLSETFQCLPDPAIPLAKDAHTGFPDHFDSLSLHNGVQSTDLPLKGATGPSLGRNIFEGSESELTESPEEVSLQSGAGSTMQPRSWANDSLDTDDDMDGMQISSGSPSTSSSTLSSPRPSMLATTVFHMHAKGKPESGLSTPESYESSPKYPIHMELHSHSPVSPLKTASESSSLSESNVQKILHENSMASSPTQSPRFSVAEPQHSPPLPPLPPLEWRMMRRFNSTLSPSSNQIASPPTQSGPSLVRPDKTFQTSKTFAVPSANNWKDSSVLLEHADTARQGSSLFFQTLENDKGTYISAQDMPDHDNKLLASPSDAKCNSNAYPLTRCDESPVDSHPSKVASEAERVLKSPPKAEGLLLSPSMNQCNIPVSPSERDDESAPNPMSPVLASNSEMEKSSTSQQRSDSTVKSSWPFVPGKLERKDSLVDAIATHDRNMLRKVPEKSRSLRPVPSNDNDRSVLLEQIRTGSFSLRHTKVKKQEVPRPTTNINVAAILEKANAIRQAFAGSDDDEDEDWST